MGVLFAVFLIGLLACLFWRVKSIVSSQIKEVTASIKAHEQDCHELKTEDIMDLLRKHQRQTDINRSMALFNLLAQRDVDEFQLMSLLNELSSSRSSSIRIRAKAMTAEIQAQLKGKSSSARDSGDT